MCVFGDNFAVILTVIWQNFAVVLAYFGTRIFLTGSANQKTKNGGGESGLRVKFKYTCPNTCLSTFGHSKRRETREDACEGEAHGC